MQVVRAGGLSIAADVAEGKDPPVVLVAQIGTSGRSWWPTIDLLAATPRPSLVVYDRPGIGDSPPRPDPNPPLPYSAFANELAALLGVLNVPPPVVLVGHSVGSVIVRAFAVRYPERVAGMVHVDGSVPGLRLWPGQEPPIDGEGPDATAFDAVAGSGEITGVDWPTAPAVVLVQTPGRWPASLPSDRDIDSVWQESAAALARDLGASLVVAANAGHQIPREAPGLVAFAIDEVVRAVRGGSVVVDLDPARVAASGGLVLG